MEMRAFGGTGMKVSVLGFGCGAVGGLMVRGSAADQQRAVARALEVGINYFDTAVQYGNLWQQEHQIGVDYNFSPQAFKPDGSVHGFYDLPLITSYSAFYRLPLGGVEDLREHMEQLPATFGVDEVSHKFNLPPPLGRPDLTVYASRSVSATPVRFGPLSIVATNTLADISSQFGQQSFTLNNNLGGKLNVPVREFWGIHSTLSFGADFKTYEAPTFRPT